MKPYQLTAAQAQAEIRNGSLTIEQYARSLLARIEQRDADVGAWAHLDPEYVVRQARVLDSVPPEQRGPLHGLAVAVKDIFNTKDMPTQHNSPIYADSRPGIDAAAVAVLRTAGALVLGKTTTTEFASMASPTSTRNPNDPARTPGGSSSGSAAAVADLQAPLALGTQTGGSIIRPASFNGIYALKPTWGAVSREGVKAYAPNLDTVGFFARAVDDLQLLVDAFALEDDDDGGAADAPFSVRGARFAVVRTVAWPSAGAGTRAALEAGAALLRAHGAAVDEVALPVAFDAAPGWHETVMHSDGRAAFLAEHRAARAQLAPFLAGHVENARGITRAAQCAALDGLAALRPQIDRLAGAYDAILTPSVVDEAPVGTASTGSPVLNAIWTALHTPVINIPGFKGENGMPIGLSLVAPRYHDRRLLTVAKAVGEVFESEGGWVRQERR
ncbi:amidase [Durotheca rogersii]|uniref:amidase n=1 Tax=Durotheca rogersii TaxID=419775 RepID=UPI002220BA42|nr:amidase [Durotheca rogersii]KAI5865707.1 amidase [Durotheca rogersii]